MRGLYESQNAAGPRPQSPPNMFSNPATGPVPQKPKFSPSSTGMFGNSAQGYSGSSAPPIKQPQAQDIAGPQRGAVPQPQAAPQHQNAYEQARAQWQEQYGSVQPGMYNNNIIPQGQAMGPGPASTAQQGGYSPYGIQGQPMQAPVSDARNGGYSGVQGQPMQPSVSDAPQPYQPPFRPSGQIHGQYPGNPYAPSPYGGYSGPGSEFRPQGGSYGQPSYYNQPAYGQGPQNMYGG